MNCRFERIDTGEIRCSVCGLTVKHPPGAIRVTNPHCGLSPAERAAKSREMRAAARKRSKPQRPSYECTHRGDELRRVACKTGCGKGTQLKVFACDVHRECLIARPQDGIQSCLNCPDKAPPPDLVQLTVPPKKPLADYSSWVPSGSVFHATDEPIAPTSDKLVISIAIGEGAQKLFALTGPAMEAYAKRIGADFVVLRDATQGWPMLEKFRVRRWAGAYARTIYLDSDVIVLPHARSLFDVVPADQMGIQDDWPRLNQTAWLIQEWQALMQSQGIECPFPKPPHAYNSGVVVTSQAHAGFWDPLEKRCHERWCDEQQYGRYNIHRYQLPVFELPERYNFQWWWKRLKSTEAFEQAARAEADLVHLSQCPAELRLELAARLLTPQGVTDAIAA